MGRVQCNRVKCSVVLVRRERNMSPRVLLCPVADNRRRTKGKDELLKTSDSRFAVSRERVAVETI